ncbi:YlbF family regulator [Halobaculum sp. MBLA0147]|uniref:YlbF family regulator n=1 Tax=Halobaculum sp. MBLA0147 TaxID=3079934 RepID=UPI003523A822
MSVDSDADERTVADAGEDGTAGAAADADDVEGLATALGEEIAALPEYRAFEEAKAAVEADDEVQSKIDEFERIRQEFALARQSGRADEDAVERVREAQQELHSMPTMARYLEAQEELEERLETLNRLISDPLAVDFGGEAGGCCRDE